MSEPKTLAGQMAVARRCKDDGYGPGLVIVNALCRVDTGQDRWKKEVVTIMEHCPRGLFRMLDENPGHWGYELSGEEWHWKLRAVRNDTKAKLFASLAKEVPA